MFVTQAYSAAGVNIGTVGSSNGALQYWQKNPAGYTEHSGDTNPPVGGLVFWGATGNPYPNPYGHVGIYLGNNTVISTASWPEPESNPDVHEWSFSGRNTTDGGFYPYLGWMAPPGVGETVPNPPTSVAASPLNDGEASVSWQSGANGGSAISSFTVTSSPSAVSDTSEAGQTSIVLDGLATGVSYTFTVTATNGVGTSGASAPSNAVTPYTYPGTPSIATVVPGNGSATVNFDPPSSDGFSPITSYVVYAADESAGEYLGEVAAPSSSPVTITGLTNGDSYGFSVQAVNAGGGSAGSDYSAPVTPLVAGDPTGDVFVTDTGNDQVVEIPAGGGPQTTIGSGFDNPQGVAVDTNGDVFVADTGNNQIVEIPAGGGPQTTIGSGFDNPQGVAVDTNGDVFVADTGNNQIVEIPAGGGPQTTIGTGFDNPQGVAVDTNGDVFVADTGNKQIVEIPAGGGPQTTVGSGFDNPQGVAVDTNGDVFVADPGNNQIVEIPAGDTGASEVTTGLLDPTAVAVDDEGITYTADSGDGRVVEADADVDAESTVGAGFDRPTGVAVESAPPAPGYVSALPGDGSISLSFPPLTGPGYGPATSYEGTCSDQSNPGNGTQMGTSTSSPVVVTGLVDGDGYSCAVSATNAVGQGPPEADPRGVAPAASVTPTGDLYVLSHDAGILEDGPAGAVQGALSGAYAEGIAVDDRGDVYATEGSNQVLELPANGSAPTKVGSGWDEPEGLAVDADGNLFVADFGSNQVVEIPANGSPQLTLGSGLMGPSSVAVDGAGNVYVVENDNTQIIEIPAGGGPEITIATGIFTDAIAADTNGDVYYADTVNNQVVRLAAGTLSSSTVGNDLFLPDGVAVDGAGDVYIADTFDDRVLEVPAGEGPELSVMSDPGEPTTLAVQSAAIASSPTAIKVRSDDATSSATVTWAPPTSDGSSAIAGYEVSSSNSDGPATLLGPQATSTTFTQLPDGVPITFSVAAVNLAGTGPDASATATLSKVTLPSAPIGLTAVPQTTAGQVLLTWSPPSSDGGSTTTKYDVYAGTSPSSLALVAAGLTESTFTVDGASSASPTFFAVKAVNSLGAGPQGVPVAAIAKPKGPTWAEAAASGGPPGIGAATAYDPKTKQLVLFGGTLGDEPSSGTWLWNGRKWTMATPAKSPPARYDASMAWDAATDQLVLFGGFSPGEDFGDTWTWSGTTWAQVTTSPAPPARAGAAMAYDAATKQLLLFGGGANSYLSDTWQWKSTKWVQLRPSTSPPGLADASMSYDPATRQLILFGGQDGGTSNGGEVSTTWSWAGKTWAQILPGASPSPRDGAAMAYDPLLDRLVLFGGFDNGTFLADTWEWTGGTWTQIASASGPEPREYGSLVWNAADSQLLLLGGEGNYTVNYAAFADTWEWAR